MQRVLSALVELAILVLVWRAGQELAALRREQAETLAGIAADTAALRRWGKAIHARLKLGPEDHPKGSSGRRARRSPSAPETDTPPGPEGLKHV
jgi:hypothetical protein